MTRLAFCVAALLLIFNSVDAIACPPMGMISPNQVGATCFTSRTCPPRSQCCETIHGMRCVEVLQEPSPSFGICSDGSSPTQSCNPGVCPPNYKCENGKCCWNNPHGPPPRPFPSGGNCEDGSVSRVSCSSHAECPFGQKCYGQWCCPDDRQTSKVCNDGTTSTMKCPQGICPVGRVCEMGWCCTTGNSGGIGGGSGQCEDGSYSNKRCSSDYQCRRHEKCYDRWCCPREIETSRRCNDGTMSNHQCMNGICPVGKVCEMGWCCTTGGSGGSGGIAKPGRCPPFLNAPNQSVSHRCYSDNECTGSRKCCGTILGRRCLFPEM